MRFAHAVLIIALSVLARPAVALAQTDPAGYWELSLDTPQGTIPVTLAITREENALSGTIGTPFGTVPVTGTRMDEAIALGTRVAGTVIEIDVQANIDGDALSGTARFAGFGEYPFTGRRVPPPPPPPELPPVPITDLNGRWNLKLSIAGLGELPASAVFKQEGEKITGVISSLVGEIVVTGTIVGTSLKLDFTAETPQGDVPVTLSGDIGETSIIGKASVAGVGEADWTATRAVVQ
ncbi:MAG: hypothetical protein AB7Q29_03470 [Vicinamibacterales bacterium]